MLLAHERLRLGHDRPHLGLDPTKVLVGETGGIGKVEVVVEPVRYGRPDGISGARPEPSHRLGQNVSGRVAQHDTALVGVGRHDAHLGAVGKRAGQIDLHAVDLGCHSRRGKPPPYHRGEIGGRRAGGDTAR